MHDNFEDESRLTETDLPDMLDVVTRAMEPDLAAVAHLQPPMRGVAEAVLEFRQTGDTQGLARLLAEGQDDVDLLWHSGSPANDNITAFERFTLQSALQQATIADDGISVCVRKDERVQLRVDWPEGDVEQAEVHLLIRSTFKAEPFFALRWLPAVGNEEVMARFRPESLVFARRLDYRSLHRASHQLLSLIRKDGADILLINGLPVIWRKAESGPLRGVVLDGIGSGDGENTLHIPLVMVGRGQSRAAPEPSVAAQLLSQVVASSAANGDLSAASGWLTGLAGIDASLEQDAGIALLNANIAHPDGYRDFLEEAVVARLDEDGKRAAADLLSGRPSPVLRLADVTVKIDPNPSKHASLRYLVSKRPDKVSLLDGVNFDAFNGDIVGIIGKNGAGKSTLLKTLVAAMPLARGRIECNDRPLLLRPGAGMQGDLTGRENVLKTGLYMGFLPHQMRDLMQDIVAFAELEDHIDRPFRYYSDGMRARLIFSLATAIPRDVLLLDELLSAGDVGFQRKAMARLDQFLRKAKLVLVVQHTFDFVLSRCTKCLLLDHGKPLYFGDPRVATELYRELH